VRASACGVGRVCRGWPDGRGGGTWICPWRCCSRSIDGGCRNGRTCVRGGDSCTQPVDRASSAGVPCKRSGNRTGLLQLALMHGYYCGQVACTNVKHRKRASLQDPSALCVQCRVCRRNLVQGTKLEHESTNHYASLCTHECARQVSLNGIKSPGCFSAYG
jgi:hypothetical protein